MSWECSCCGCFVDDDEHICPVCDSPQPKETKKNECPEVHVEVEYEWFIVCPHCHNEKRFENEEDAKENRVCPYCHENYELEEPERIEKQAPVVPMCLHFQVLNQTGAPDFSIHQGEAEKGVVLGREGDVAQGIFPNTVGRKHCTIGYDALGWYIEPIDVAHRISLDQKDIIEKSYLNLRKPFCLKMANCLLRVALQEVKQKE